MQSALKGLANRCIQPGAMDDLNFFLSRPQLRKKTPSLLSLSRNIQADAPDATVLLYEHHIAGRGTGIFATDDTTGRRTLVSRPSQRTLFALSACRHLLKRGAQCVLISFRHEEVAINTALGEQVLEDSRYSCRWASREREIAGYLPFEATLDMTLAKLGARTRNHLRYYRRRAENQLGCVFVPEVKISREDFIELNRISAYPVSDETAGWRYDSLGYMKAPLFCGLRDRDGRWLSLMGGRYYDCNFEMHWQINRTDMPEYSLATVMRAFHIEHEVQRGTRRMYVEGGTTHSMSHAFVPEKSTDLIVMRQSPIARMIPGMVKRFLPPENMLLQVLEDEAMSWHTVKRM
ncbi:hypothetical protein H7846_01670 [Edaphobacter sp. 4G125]|nr:hypothetical protein H7846_01670 [Edaphobacter sp. 4G125]